MGTVGGTAKGPGVNLNRAGSELGYAVNLEERIIKLGVFLWYYERFVCLAILVNIAQVDSCKQSSLSFTAEGNPPAVARPAMPGLGILAVYFEPLVIAGPEVH